MIQTRINENNNTIEIFRAGSRPSKDQILAVIPPQPFFQNHQQLVAAVAFAAIQEILPETLDKKTNQC